VNINKYIMCDDIDVFNKNFDLIKTLTFLYVTNPFNFMYRYTFNKCIRTYNK